MGCPSFVMIGSNLKFTICTHDPDTGVLTDADAVPSYRVYEDETATAILTGDMAKLDDDNTTGFYSEIIACTIANGFEDGKTYTIYIEATVDGDKGGISFDFTAYTDDIGTAGAGLTAIPWNATWDAEVQSEVDDALSACSIADGDTITANTIRETLRMLKWFVRNQRKVDKTASPDELIIFKDDDATPGLTHALTDDSNESTREKAT